MYGLEVLCFRNKGNSVLRQLHYIIISNGLGWPWRLEGLASYQWWGKYSWISLFQNICMPSDRTNINRHPFKLENPTAARKKREKVLILCTMRKHPLQCVTGVLVMSLMPVLNPVFHLKQIFDLCLLWCILYQNLTCFEYSFWVYKNFIYESFDN